LRAKGSRLAKKLVCTALFGGSLKRFSADTGFDGELSAWWTDFVTKIKMLAHIVFSIAKQIKTQIKSTAAEAFFSSFIWALSVARGYFSR
jgi:hypothetical protein